MTDIFGGSAVAGIVFASGIIGLLFAALLSWNTSKIRVRSPRRTSERHTNLLDDVDVQVNGDSDVDSKIGQIASYISRGAEAFLRQEYAYMAVFIVLFGAIVVVVIGASTKQWVSGALTCASFVAGSVTSIISGYIGMKIAVYANSRTAISARQGWGPAFVTAFQAGAVMGFALVSLGLLILYVLINVLGLYRFAEDDMENNKKMFECIAGYGLGGSSIALFGRVGGGIYTKAADVGADLVGKFENGMNEDDPRNPAVIADNVGDNVGDIAGMGADLFGSFAEATCAAMVVSCSCSLDKAGTQPLLATGLVVPLLVTALGIFNSFLTSIVSTHIYKVKKNADIETSLKLQIIISTILMTPFAYVLTRYGLPSVFYYGVAHTEAKNWYVFICILVGLWSGLIIGLTTEYYTSKTYRPVQEVAESCNTGAATNIIYGLALGYKSVIIPAFCIGICIFVGFKLVGMLGIAYAALGILSTLATGLTIDAYGPICDNAGGIAEMSGMDEEIRDITDALDAAGNTTAAIGKGFAIGSAALVSLALFGGFIDIYTGIKGNENIKIDLLDPFVFFGLLIGAMLPYWFSAMTMKSVGKAAFAMVHEVRRQFIEIDGIMSGDAEPEYEKCVEIATKSSLREMIAPGALVMLSPLFFGFFFGCKCLAGLLAGALVSGVQMAISASNTGGAWDNAKKYIEAGLLGEGKGKGSPEHGAAVIGDTVGDPLKDTSGPALNILIKLMAIISLVFANAIAQTNNGEGLIGYYFNKH